MEEGERWGEREGGQEMLDVYIKYKKNNNFE